jgi:D-3-phosphoglycerate dehydrogenase
MTGEGLPLKAPARLAYFDNWVDPVAGEMLQEAAGIAVDRLALRNPPSESWALLERCHGYQVVTRTEIAQVSGTGQFLADAALMHRCPDLLALCSAGAGYDVIDVRAATAAGVIVCNQSGSGHEAVAEHALALMLGLAKKIGMADRIIRRTADWNRLDFQGNDMLGKTLGVIGFGQIGRRVAELCAGLFRMTVLVFDPYVAADTIAPTGASAASLKDLLARSDFVSVSAPLTAETRGMVGRAEFALMKPTAYFVTTARGGVHDEAALVDALRRGEIAGAGIDVFEVEPPPPDHPLFAFDNVIATPHSAGITVEAARNIAMATAEQWKDIFAGKVPPRLINPEAWPDYARRFEAKLGFRPADLPA